MRFAENVRHGLVCNLLDNGNNPRFNARDAAWWFMQVCCAICNMVCLFVVYDVVSYLLVERARLCDDVT